MYGTDLSVQITNLMPFAGLGFVLGFLYDISGLLRSTFPKCRLIVFFSDFFYCLFATISTYLLLLGTANGFIRIYLIITEIIGAVVYFLTFGTLVSAIVKIVSDTVRRCFSPVFILRRKIGEKIMKILKKMKNKFKKPLKDVQ